MLKKIIWVVGFVAGMLAVSAQASTHVGPEAKGIFGVDLYIENFSSFTIQMREDYMFPINVYPHSTSVVSTDWFDNLYGVGFYYLTVYGTYYPVPNCPMGNFYHDARVMIHDAYVNGYLVPACG